jgi:hypothetical protein
MAKNKKSQEMVTVQRVAGGSLHDARVVPPAPDRRPEPLTTVTPEGAEEAMTAREWGAGTRTIDGVGVKGRRVRAKGTRQREQRALAKREVPRKVQPSHPVWKLLR